MKSPRRVGRYAIHDEIGVGGMATVFFGLLGGVGGFSRVVAIKSLHKHLARSEKFVSAFLDEARLASRIRHPNVMPTLDVIESNGELLIVMEYVAGAPLSELGRAPPPIAAAIVHGMLQGLHAAHIATDENGEPLKIVHRDVSPHNVLVGTDGVPRVLDFGVAKAERKVHSTAPGEVKGKLGYMAPEQVMLEESSPRVDVYAAGAVLWETLTGRPLFEAENQVALLSKMLNDPILPPSLFADVPLKLDAVVLKALTRNADARFDSAQEFALALERAISLAPQRDVATFVMERAKDTLAKRAATVAAIERVAAEETISDDGILRPMGRPNESFTVSSLTLSEAGQNVPPKLSSSDTPTLTEQLPPPPLQDLIATIKDAEQPPEMLALYPPTATPTNASVESLGLPRRTKSTLSRALLIGVGIALVIGVWVAVTNIWPSGSTPETSPPATAAAAAPSTASIDAPPSPTPPAPTPPPTETATSPTPPPSTKPPTTATTKAPPRPNKCANPYFIDEAGIKRIKRECM